MFESTQNRKGPCKTEGCKYKVRELENCYQGKNTFFFFFSRKGLAIKCTLSAVR